MALPAFRPAAPLRLGRAHSAHRSVCARRRPSACLGDAEDAAAWAAWDRARTRPEEAAESAPPRDPQAETDFWRSAAREVGSNVVNEQELTQSEVWAGAREVTADMDEMQRRLSDELEAYDPAQAIQEYREAARELTNTGPESEVGTVEHFESVEKDKDDWDPGAAWAAFDSVVTTTDAERKAREARMASTAFDYSPSTGLSDSIDVKQKATTSLDEVDDEDIPSRDPKKETDFWRATARELISDQPPTRDVLQYNFADDGTDDAAFGPASDEPDWRTPFTPESTSPSVSRESDNNKASPWDAWNAANATWAEGLGLKPGPFVKDEDPRPGDWGAGLRDTGSERDRWRAWGDANAPKVVKRKGRSAGGNGALGDDTQLWMQAARQVTGKDLDEELDAATTQNEAVPRGHGGLGVGIEFWKNAARELDPQNNVDDGTAGTQDGSES